MAVDETDHWLHVGVTSRSRPKDDSMNPSHMSLRRFGQIGKHRRVAGTNARGESQKRQRWWHSKWLTQFRASEAVCWSRAGFSPRAPHSTVGMSWTMCAKKASPTPSRLYLFCPRLSLVQQQTSCTSPSPSFHITTELTFEKWLLPLISLPL